MGAVATVLGAVLMLLMLLLVPWHLWLPLGGFC
jgi:hypothetical protein